MNRKKWFVYHRGDNRWVVAPCWVIGEIGGLPLITPVERDRNHVVCPEFLFEDRRGAILAAKEWTDRDHRC